MSMFVNLIFFFPLHTPYPLLNEYIYTQIPSPEIVTMCFPGWWYIGEDMENCLMEWKVVLLLGLEKVPEKCAGLQHENVFGWRKWVEWEDDLYCWDYVAFSCFQCWLCVLKLKISCIYHSTFPLPISCFFFYFKPLGWLLSIIMWRNRMDYSWGFMRCAWWACCPFRLVIDFKAATTIAPELFPRNTEHFFGGWDKKSRNLLPLSAIDWYLLRLVTL